MIRTTTELINIIVYKILYIVRSKTCEVKYSINEYFMHAITNITV